MINKTNGVFTEEDENMLSSFSAQAAVALAKTELFQKTEEMRLYQHSILSSITSCVITLNDGMRMVCNKINSLFIYKVDSPQSRVCVRISFASF